MECASKKVRDSLYSMWCQQRAKWYSVVIKKKHESYSLKSYAYKGEAFMSKEKNDYKS